MVGLDIATGMAAALATGTLSSRTARKGLIHKSAFLFAILLAHILDYAQSFVNLGLPFELQVAVCGYIIICETLSIVENLAIINPELRGTPLLQLFKNTTDGGSTDGGSTGDGSTGDGSTGDGSTGDGSTGDGSTGDPSNDNKEA